MNWFKRRSTFEKNEICKAIGVSKKYYSHWATGNRNPNNNNRVKVKEWSQDNTPHDLF